MRKSWLLIVRWLLAADLAGRGGGTETETTILSTQAPAEPTETPTDTPVPPPASIPTAKPTDDPTPTPTVVRLSILRLMTGQVVDAVARNSVEIELLQVQDDAGRVW